MGKFMETIPAVSGWKRQWVLIPQRGKDPIGSVVQVGEDEFFSVVDGQMKYMKNIEKAEDAQKRLVEMLKEKSETEAQRTAVIRSQTGVIRA